MIKHTVTTIRDLLEADNRLRKLERTWKESGTLEDELAYLKETVRLGMGIELSDLSVEFTRWKEAREWFKKIYASGKWATIFRLRNVPMHRIVPDILNVLAERLESRWALTKGSIKPHEFEVVALGWRSYQVLGFNIYFLWRGSVRNHPAYSSEMCASLWANTPTLRLQAMNAECPHRALTSSSTAFHKDTILIDAPGGGTAIWNTHISAGS